MTALDPGTRFTLDRHLPPDFAEAALRADVRAGLSRTPKTLPPKWFYDARGSDLFTEITRLPEYYPTRAEREILAREAAEIAAASRRGDGRRAGLGLVREDPAAARRAARRGDARAATSPST